MNMYKIIDLYPYLRALLPEQCSCWPKENICVFICGTVPAVSYSRTILNRWETKLILLILRCRLQCAIRNNSSIQKEIWKCLYEKEMHLMWGRYTKFCMWNRSWFTLQWSVDERCKELVNTTMKSCHITVKTLHSHAIIALVDTQSCWIDENLKKDLLK
jgi:hypothetical protein